MKKILALSVALALMASAVFAQEDTSEKKWKFTFTADTVADVLYTNVKTLGDDYLKEGQPFNLTGTEHPVYWSQFGMFSNFGALDWSHFDGNEFRIRYDYTGEFVTFYARANLDAMIKGLLGKDTNWKVIVATFDEVTLTAQMGDMFKAEVSNTNKRGIFDSIRYDGAYDDFGKSHFTGFGVQTVAADDKPKDGIWAAASPQGYQGLAYTPLKVTGHEVNNFAKDAGGSNPIPGFLLTGIFGPVNAQIYGGVISTETLKYAWWGNDTVATKMAANLGIRVEAPKLADLVDLAAIYKFTAVDTTRTGWSWADEMGNSDQKENDPNGDGTSTHAFGIYANIAPIETLGIAVGYSGQFAATEDHKEGDTYKFTHPYWSGIDLKVHFAGIERLPLDFTTNISFAGVKGDSDAKTIIYGLDGETDMDNDDEQNALAWGVGLAANFSLTEKLIINGTFGNTLSTATVKDSTGETIFTQNVLRFYAGIIYAANPNVTFRGGIALRNTGNAEENNPKTGSGYKRSANAFEFGIPIGLKVTF